MVDLTDLANLDLPFLNIVIYLVLGSVAWTTYLDLRQRKKLKEKYGQQSKALKGIQNEKEFNSTCAYALDKQNFGFVKRMVSTVETILFLKYYIFPWVWGIAGEYAANEMSFLGRFIDPEAVHAIVFMWITGVWDTVTSIPFDLYYDFVIEERHGFNKKTFGLFVMDLIKSFFIYTIFMSPLIMGWAFIWIIKLGGDNFPLYVLVGGFILILSLLTVYPIFIQPCFDKVEPLDENIPEEKELKTQIEALAGGLGFPLTKLRKIDGSKRSSHSNAYQYGLCNNKSIVIFDTLMEQCEHDEIVAILGHELGHWKFAHIWWNVGIMEFNLLWMMSLFQLCMGNMNLFTAFGYKTQSIFIGFKIFEMLLSGTDPFMTFMLHWFSRSCEFQADRFAVELGKGEKLKTGLVKINKENKGVLNTDGLYATYHFSHPTILTRLSVMKEEMAKKGRKEN